MSLRGRLTLLSTVFLVVALGASIGGATLFTRARDASRHHAQIDRAVTTAGDFDKSLVTQAASIRAYFLAADPSSLQGYSDARQESTDLASRLAGLVTGARLSRDVENASHAALTWRTTAVNPLIALEQQGAYQQVIDQYSNGDAAPLFKDVTRAIRVLDRDLATAENAAASHADATRLHALEFGIGFAVAVALAFVFVRVAATAWLVRPINTLAEHMRMADAVDDIPAAGGPAELRELAQSSEGLRDRLHDELAQAARTRSMLGQHSDALMALRARTHLAARTLPPGWDMCADLVPATGIVAADGYDVTCIGTTMTVLLVEAAEHGVDAAAAGLRAKELVRAALRTHTDVGSAIAWASELMPDAMKLGVTVLVARLDCNNGELSFASAGHPEALLCDGLRVELLSETGPLFGTRNGTWTTRKLTVQPGQIFIAFTDGLLAGRTDSHARFGPERLGQVVHDNYGDSCEGIVKQVLIEAGAFVPGRCHDDIAVAVVARAMPM